MEFIVRLLAVIGGAALGAIVVGFVAHFLGKMLGVKSVPRRPLFVLRGLAAVVAGWAAWLLVFGTGGGGIGGAGGLGHRGGNNEIVEAQGTAQLAESSMTSEPARNISVVMLGGARVRDERFYVVLGEKTPLTFTELKDFIRTQQKTGLRAIHILMYENSVAQDHAALANLREWAEQIGLDVNVSTSTGEAP